MGRRTTTGPVARLGRPVSTARPVRAVVLLLPDGQLVSHRSPSRVATTVTTRALARHLIGQPSAEGLVVHPVHYRWRGWNGEAAHPVADAEWALEEVWRAYGDVPVCLVGRGMGARAALRAAGHPTVEAVAALATWLPRPPAEPHPGEAVDDAPAGEPVAQLAGRQVLLVHGTEDRRSPPEGTYRLGLRAKEATARVCRFEAHGDDHRLRGYRGEVRALVADFALGALYARDFSRPLTDALLAPAPLGLRMPLATGFGRTLRRPLGPRRPARGR